MRGEGGVQSVRGQEPLRGQGVQPLRRQVLQSVRGQEPLRSEEESLQPLQSLLGFQIVVSE